MNVYNKTIHKLLPFLKNNLTGVTGLLVMMVVVVVVLVVILMVLMIVVVFLLLLMVEVWMMIVVVVLLGVMMIMRIFQIKRKIYNKKVVIHFTVQFGIYNIWTCLSACPI
jgi:hypothetical protein